MRNLNAALGYGNLTTLFSRMNHCYLQLIKDYYPCILQKHADVTGKQLLWELIKMEIRSETIRYSKRKSRQLKTRESTIQSQDQQNLLEYEILKKELQGISEANGRGAIFRSKVRGIQRGEKPTKYFFNLEKRNYMCDKKIVSQLYNGEEELLSDFKKINKEIELLYLAHRDGNQSGAEKDNRLLFREQ